MMLIAWSLCTSPGHLASTSIRNLWLISKMICMCRGRSSSIIGTGHFSNASGRIVWLVYPNVRRAMSHASSQGSISSSSSSRISSGMEMDGCVSLS